MGKFFSTFQKDVMVQVRNNIYGVTFIIALLFAVVFTFALNPNIISLAIPAAILFLVGGTTLAFIGGLILDEKDKGILLAMVLSPLSTKQYLWSKIASITFLAVLEIGIMAGGPVAYFTLAKGVALPNIPIFIVAIIAINLLYSLLGVTITVRYRKMTEYMIPVVFCMIFFQIPILYYANIITSPLLLAIPSAAPVMLVHGAFNSLELWQWIYSFGYTALILVVLSYTAIRAYKKYIIGKLR